MATVFAAHADVDVPGRTHATACPRCGEGLSLHQPDGDLPDRLLGTCDHCKGWFLVNAECQVKMTLLVGD